MHPPQFNNRVALSSCNRRTSLRLFGYIKSYAQFLQEFGASDASAPKEAFGDLMGYEHYYKKCQKFVEWDEMGKKIVVINFGGGAAS